MAESITISVPTTMPLVERLSEVNKRLSEWLESLDKPFINWKDELKLEKWQRVDGQDVYHYGINRGSKNCVTVANFPCDFT